jgi:hypothetical protein
MPFKRRDKKQNNITGIGNVKGKIIEADDLDRRFKDSTDIEQFEVIPSVGNVDDREIIPKVLVSEVGPIEPTPVVEESVECKTDVIKECMNGTFIFIKPQFDIASFRCAGINSEIGEPFKDDEQRIRWNKYLSDGWEPINFQWNEKTSVLIVMFRKS